MNERIKLIRIDANLSQVKFAEKLGISRVALQKLEAGENSPSEQTIRSLCREFCITRSWLESGEGPMYMPEAEDDQIIDDILSGDNEFVKAVIRGIAKTPGGWEKMREVFEAIQKELNEKKPE